MRNILPLLMTAFSAIAFAADPLADPKLPSDAQRAMDAFQKAEDDANKVRDATIAKAAETATKGLEKAMVAATKRGDLDAANAIKAKLTELKASAPAEAESGHSGGPQTGTETTNPLPIFIGNWQLTQKGAYLTNLTVNKDGTASWGSTPGTWTKEGNTLKFSWGNTIDVPTSTNCTVIDHGRNGAIYTISISK